MKHKLTLISIAMAALVLVSLCAVGASTLSVSAAPGSSANAGAPAVVGAPVGAGAPAVVAVSATKLELFIRSADNALYVKNGSVNSAGTWTWSTATSLGGIITAAPAATSNGTNQIDVFVRGNDGALWSRITANNGAPLSAWQTLGGKLAANTGPGACSWGSGRVDVFVNGTDGALWHKMWNGTSWSAWQSLGGKLTSSPAATATPATGTTGNQIGVFVVGTDHAVWYLHYDGTTWSKWTSVGGQVYAGTSPAAYNWGTSRIGWFVTGTTQALYHNWKQFTTGGTTSGYENLGGYLTSSPGATAYSDTMVSKIDVFARGGSGDFSILWQKAYDPSVYPNGGWADWASLPFP
jgi:hypothetical protein